MSLDQHATHATSQLGSGGTSDALLTQTADERKRSEVIRTLINVVAPWCDVALSLAWNDCWDMRTTIRTQLFLHKNMKNLMMTSISS